MAVFVPIISLVLQLATRRQLVYISTRVVKYIGLFAALDSGIIGMVGGHGRLDRVGWV